MSKQADVEQVLSDMRQALQDGKTILIPREKNMNTLANMGRTWASLKPDLMSLSYTDYISGPEIDRDRPQEDMLWVFKKRIDQDMIYIKFKIRNQTDGCANFISFHLDEIKN